MSEKIGAIYQAIVDIMREVGAIKKEGRNKEQNYDYRRIADIYNRISPLLAIHGVICVPRVTASEFTEVQSKSGGTLHRACLRVMYKFYATDGSFIEAETAGESIDSSDKANSKAQTMAHKVALSQILAIPFEAVDPEVNSPEWAAAYRGRVSASDLLTLKRGWFDQNHDDIEQLQADERAKRFVAWVAEVTNREFDARDHRLWTGPEYATCLEVLLAEEAPTVA